MKKLYYKIASGNTKDTLESKVQDLIEMGFRPHGSIAVIHDTYAGDITTIQPMIAELEEEPAWN